MTARKSKSAALRQYQPIIQAMRKAVREALLRHKKLGFPVVVEKNGKVVWIPPQDIPE
ncbi:MAG: hypothetical protein ABFD92_14065 [Planctomycetaceae bacterium]|nr:hypothetical protein [Planctomycetaceae bacterium]